MAEPVANGASSNPMEIDITTPESEQEIHDVNRVSAPEEPGLRINLLPGSDEHAASFEFLNEGHTLGNALKTMILKNPKVEFCAYTVPHPAEQKMRLRIQMYDEESVYDALETGLSDLLEMCDIVSQKFTLARDAFGKTQVNGGEGEAMQG